MDADQPVDFAAISPKTGGRLELWKPTESTPGDLLILRCRVRAPGDPPVQGRFSSGARRPFRPGCPKVVQPDLEPELQLLIG